MTPSHGWLMGWFIIGFTTLVELNNLIKVLNLFILGEPCHLGLLLFNVIVTMYIDSPIALPLCSSNVPETVTGCHMVKQAVGVWFRPTSESRPCRPPSRPAYGTKHNTQSVQGRVSSTPDYK